MASKHLTFIELHIESGFPVAGSATANLLFTYNVEELPELGDQVELVSLPVSGSMTLAQVFTDARSIASGSLSSAGQGGHTIVDG